MKIVNDLKILNFSIYSLYERIAKGDQRVADDLTWLLHNSPRRLIVRLVVSVIMDEISLAKREMWL